MEKFGIFNILSALSQFAGTPADDHADGPEPERASAAPQSAAAGGADDASGPRESEPTGVFTAQERMDRLARVLERHEAIARRINKKNRP